jgi:peroxiredoxin
LHPHERSLVETYNGRPFVILGVGCDSDPGTMRDTQQKQQITWRSFWNEGGAISREWGVTGLPTLFIIDAEGKVQESFEGKPSDAKLDAAIEKWVKAAEKAKS